MKQLITPPTNITPAVDRDDAMASHVRRLSTIVAKDMFNNPILYPDQIRVLDRLALMKFRFSSIKTAPVLFAK